MAMVESHSNEHVDIVRLYDPTTSWTTVNKRSARYGGDRRVKPAGQPLHIARLFEDFRSYFAHALYTRGNSTSLPD
jgi:hypothetical protein